MASTRMSSVFSDLGDHIQDPPISWLMELTLDKPDLISLAAGFTDQDTLPVLETQSALNRFFKQKSRAAKSLQYGTASGDDALRCMTVKRVADADRTAGSEWEPNPDQVMITHGSQQFLYMLVEAFCDPGDLVLVEDPTYFVFLGMLEGKRVESRGVRMDSGGVCLDHLEQTLRDLDRSGMLPKLKFLYLVTYYQNPSGITTEWERKRGALDLLRYYERKAGHPIYLVEDAAYRDLGFLESGPPSALGLKSHQNRVIYTGTYSKPFATGIRVGYGISPLTVQKVLLRIKGNHDFGTSHFIQRIIAETLTSGLFLKHLQIIHRRYKRKADIMAKAIRSSFPGEVEWNQAAGGLYIWVKAPARVRTGTKGRFFKAALSRNVLYVPGIYCYARDPRRNRPDQEMRLSFGGAAPSRIKEGIIRLGEAFEEVM